jgi:hypothetical protein
MALTLDLNKNDLLVIYAALRYRAKMLRETQAVGEDGHLIAAYERLADRVVWMMIDRAPEVG